MKKNVLIFGTISGLISVLWLIIAMTILPFNMHMSVGMVLGYTSMIIANAFLIVGVKNYRDKYNGGIISFGKALKVGLLIALVASTLYVGSWLIYYYGTDSNFLEYYVECTLKELAESGASVDTIAAQTKEMNEFMVMYQNPFFNAMVSYTEILPVGILFAVITAFIMKRKTPKVIKISDKKEEEEDLRPLL